MDLVGYAWLGGKRSRYYLPDRATLTPRARATEPGRGPDLRAVYRRLCAPQPREHESPATGKEKVADVQKVHWVYIRSISKRLSI